ncbi:hypothetical protein SAMN04488510_13210 [Fervidobacterium changbaicum]|uniref:Outer membrane protein beta-barrel domain-containing protein n=1 Tax=Fervidobacterium changbaicum TaxID=310769 RepID=A0ABX5QT00_9BACT|nr:hypothetical protein [Fervidobacterium changbaicum]QAV33646.1 hypothetical protein CBS1_07885 [Fervidobacterium changbaicum]SDH76702.1 hypothetical protein SAMN04488510_13210 [Fervidobacterium changbaicum]
MLRTFLRRALVFYLLTLIVFGFAYFNFGVGYNYGNSPNWVLRLGYEESGFTLNADWTVNKLWNIYGGVYFGSDLGLIVGPTIYATYDYSASENAFSVVYGPVVGFTNKQLSIQIGYLSDFRSIADISDAVFASLRFYIPDPPRMRMKDKLYVEALYYKGCFKIVIGLLEPYF